MKITGVYRSRGVNKPLERKGIYMSKKKFASPDFFQYLLDTSEGVRSCICKEMSKKDDIKETRVILKSIQTVDRLNSEIVDVCVAVLKDDQDDMYIISMGRLDEYGFETILQGMAQFVEENHTYNHLYALGIALPDQEKTTSD